MVRDLPRELILGEAAVEQGDKVEVPALRKPSERTERLPFSANQAIWS
jgi:hypothetical protein